MKHILRINPFFYILFLIFFLTGEFKIFLNIMTIALLHELGHLMVAIMFNYKIKEINVVPFGFYTIIEKPITTTPIKEFILIAAGPFMHIFTISNPISRYLLYFNLLPIFPLDGSKILNLCFNIFLPFKFSYSLSLFISAITLFLVFLKFNLVALLIMIMYLFQTYLAKKDFIILWYRFLKERKNIKFQSKKLIKGDRKSVV